MPNPFSTPLPLFDSGDPTRVSREPVARRTTADTSGSTLLGAAGNLFIQGVSIADEAVKDTILSQEQEIADEFFNSDPLDTGSEAFDTAQTGAIGEDADIAQGGIFGFSDNDVPVAVRSAFRSFERRQSGVEQGRVSQTFFMDRLDKDLKSLRSRFPGHREYIDGEARRLTGVPSANALHTKRLSLQTATSTLAEKRHVALINARQAALATGQYPAQMVDSMDFETAKKAKGLADGAIAADAQYKATMASRKLSREQEFITTNTKISQQARADMEVAFIGVPGGRDALIEQGRDIMANRQQYTAEQVKQWGASARALIDKQRERQIINITTSVKGERSQLEVLQETDPSLTAATVVDGLMANQDNLIEGFLSDDKNVYNVMTNNIAREVENSTNRLLNEVPALKDIQAKLGAYGKHADAMLEANLITGLRINTKLASDVDKVLAGNPVQPKQRMKDLNWRVQSTMDYGRGAGSKGTLPVVTQTEQTRMVKGAGGTPSEQAETLKLLDDTHMSILLDPHMPREMRVARAKHFFNSADREYLLNVQASEQQGMYNKRYNPTVARAVASLGDPRLERNFMIQAQSDLAALKTTTAGRLTSANSPLLDITVDPASGLLKTERQTSSIDELGMGHESERQADQLEKIVKGFNQMALQYEGSMRALNENKFASEEGADNIPGFHIKEFYKGVVGVTDMTGPKSDTVKVVQAAVANTPALIPEPPITGTPADAEQFAPQGGETEETTIAKLEEALLPPTTPADKAGADRAREGRLAQEGPDFPTRDARAGTDDDQGLDSTQNLVFDLALPPEEVDALVSEVFPDDVTRVGIENAAAFKSLLKGSGKFPEVGNFGSGFFESLRAFLGDPASSISSENREALIKWVTTVHGPEPGVDVPTRKPLEVPDRKPVTVEKVDGIDVPVRKPLDLPERKPVTEPAVSTGDIPSVSPEEEGTEVDFDAVKALDAPVLQRASLRPESERTRAVRAYTVEQVESLRPMLNSIASAESAGNYNAMNQGTNSRKEMVGLSTTNTARQVRHLGKPLTEHTIGEIKKLQKGSYPTRLLFAAGRYQIIPKTMPDALKGTGIKDSDLFNEENQDIMGINLAMNKRPKLGAYIRGKSNNLRAAMLGLALEWASYPHPDTGKSAYGKPNKASAKHSRAKVTAMLQAARKAFAIT